jgi:hypothetical protein
MFCICKPYSPDIYIPVVPSIRVVLQAKLLDHLDDSGIASLVHYRGYRLVRLAEDQMDEMGAERKHATILKKPALQSKF